MQDFKRPADSLRDTTRTCKISNSRWKTTSCGCSRPGVVKGLALPPCELRQIWSKSESSARRKRYYELRQTISISFYVLFLTTKTKNKPPGRDEFLPKDYPPDP